MGIAGLRISGLLAAQPEQAFSFSLLQTLTPFALGQPLLPQPTHRNLGTPAGLGLTLQHAWDSPRHPRNVGTEEQSTSWSVLLLPPAIPSSPSIPAFALGRLSWLGSPHPVSLAWLVTQNYYSSL